MKVKQITSFELYKLRDDLTSLEGAWFDKCFHNKRENKLLIRLRTKNQKKSLFFLLPHFLFVKNGFFIVDWALSNLTVLIRKNLKNSKLIGIEQVGFDRIIKLKFSPGYSLLIELFDKGAVVLTDKDTIIISSSQMNNAQRDLKLKCKYKEPKNKIIEPFSLTNKDFKKLVSKFKISAVKVLASKLGFGKLYAEEICFRARVEKNKTKLDDSDIDSIIRAIKELKDEKPGGFVYTKSDKKDTAKNKTTPPMECSIVRLKSLKEGFNVKEFIDFFDALNFLYENIKFKEEEAEEKRLCKEEIIIKKQEENLKNLIREESENRVYGEGIFTHYKEIEAAIKLVGDTVKKKEKNSDKVKGIKEKNKAIKDTNLKDKYFIIEI